MDARALLCRATSERDLQAYVADLCHLAGCLYFHCHDSRRSPAGFPDGVIIRPPERYPAPWLIFAELKSERGRLSRAQQGWAAALRGVEEATGGALAYRLWRPSERDAIAALVLGAAREAVAERG